MGNYKLQITMSYKIPRLSDASIPQEQIAKKIVEDSRRNIRRQTSPHGMGGAFAPLSENTIRKKRKAGYSRPEEALNATGLMYKNIRVFRIGKNKYGVGVAAVGSPKRDLVSLIHQEIGVKSKKGNIARPFIGISPATRKFAMDRMARWIRNKQKETPPRYIKFSTSSTM